MMLGVSDLSARVLWSRPLRLRSSPESLAATAHALVVAERHSRLVRLDPGSGALVWEQRVEDCLGSTVIAGQRCLYLSQAGVLHCFDLGTGRPLWSRRGLTLRRYVTVSGSVVLLGGWRGYHRLSMLALADGEPVPAHVTALPDARRLAWPPAWRRDPGGALDADGVLIADDGRASLLLLSPRSGAVLAEWPLPAPVLFPDVGTAFSIGEDDRVTFLCGRRTVMVADPAGGVEVCWQHERDLSAHPPLLSGHILWLLEHARITVVDLARGTARRVADVARGMPFSAVLVPGGILSAYADGSLVTVDRAGKVGAAVRLPGSVDQLCRGGGGLVHAVCKGHLVTLEVSTSDGGDAATNERRRTQ